MQKWLLLEPIKLEVDGGVNRRKIIRDIEAARELLQSR
jgi:hypothetical protein